MKAKTDLGKEVLDIVKDTKEYLLFLKETGVAEVFTEEPPMSQGLTRDAENRRGFLTPSDKSRRLEDLREKIGECKRCK
ncbi:MAG: hypothetical protein U0940_00215, partial [Nitrospirota bacterium]|nr:hypothetical protein [Nitrospirota bacterium]